MNWRSILLFAALSGFVFVGLGAFGAHGLSKLLDSKQMAWLQTGLLYQALHTVVMLVLGVMMLHNNNRWLRYSGFCFALGILLFSGSLYSLAIFSARVWPYITPIGGGMLLIGWLLLLVGVLTINSKSK